MNKEWKAKWIMEEQFSELLPISVFHKQLDSIDLPKHREDLKNRHMLIRKVFELPEKFGSAFLDISADDYYKLYVNGRFVGQGPAPAYYFHYNYNRYDISHYLQKGSNVISVHVYYQGLINRVWNSGDYRQGMIAELFVDDRLYLFTDASWKYKIAQEYTGTETFGYETQYAENIDNRLKEVGWMELDYKEDQWKNSCESSSDDHALVLQITPPLEVYEVKPATIKILDEGRHYLIDFGQEITGQFKMEAEGKSGETVHILCGEELEEGSEEHVRYKLRCNCTYKEVWTLSDGKNVLEHYDYKAFRYVEVIAESKVLLSDTFHAVVRHYPLDEEKCKFKSSDRLLNQIWKMCKNGVKYGSQEVFVDCPSREKGQYLGDATVTTHAHLYLSGDLRLFKKELQDFALSSRICQGLMAVAPGSYMQEIADFSLQWPLQLMTYYRQSGDLEFLREMYPVAEGIIKYFRKYQREDGLLENVKEKWNLVDWPENLRDDYDFDLSTVVGDGCHNVINAFFIGAVKVVGEIRKILTGDTSNEFEMLKKAYINGFYHNDINLFVDSTRSAHASIHSNFIPLFYGLIPEQANKSIVKLIREKRLNCGVYNAYFLLKGLASIGEYDLVYELLTSREEHSWVNMLREGATTCFEAWGKEQKWNTSLCHPWASSPIPVIIEDILGLTPGKPGWKEINFTPHIPKELESLTFEVHTVQGRVKISYEKGKVDIEAPDGIHVNWVKE